MKELRKKIAHADPRKKARLQGQLERARVRERILACTRCTLAESRTQAVPFSAGRIPATVVVIGEAPGGMEDKAGEPFVGPSGKKLDSMLEAAGISRREAFIMNTVNCRPPQNRAPAESEVAACTSHFEAQLALSRAWVGILLGQSAYARIHPKPQAIGRARGVPFWHEGRVWMPTYHPAYGLRNPKYLPFIAADIKYAVEIAVGKRQYPLWEIDRVTRVDENEIRSQLQKKKWVVLRSRVLNAEIVYKLDEHVRVPRKMDSLVHYTVDELVKIGEISHRPSFAPNVLEAIHLVKSEGGEIA